MREKIVREITQEQYNRAKVDHNYTNIFQPQEYMYGIFNEYFYQEDGKFYVSYRLGESCD